MAGDRQGVSPGPGRARGLAVIACAGLALGQAAAALAQPPSFETVVARLRDPDASGRIAAIRLLAEAGYPEAAAPVAALLADPDDRVQLEAIDAERLLFMLEPIVRKRRVGFVVEVRAESVGEQSLAAGPLAVVPRAVPPELLAGLTAVLRDDNPRVRLEALYVFGIIAPLAGPAWRVPQLGEALGWVVESLRRGQVPLQVAAARVSARVMKDCGVAAVPASADGSPSPCAAVGDSLVEAINSREATLRLASMRALGSLRYPFALQALTQQFAYYRRGEAAEAALEGLAGIAHPSSVPLFAELAAGGDPGIRRRAVEGLGRSGDRSQLAAVERVAASDRSPEVQLAAAFASQRLGESGASRSAGGGAGQSGPARAGAGVPGRIGPIGCVRARRVPAGSESCDARDGGRHPRILRRRARRAGARSGRAGRRRRRVASRRSRAGAPPPGCRGAETLVARLPRAFYARATLEVAADLLGKVLVHRTPGGTTSGVIVEVEAYVGESDPACHAASGLTRRNAPLYGPPGRAYVYLNYGVHYLMNVVTEPEGSPAAVLIRALEPLEGIALMRRRRARVRTRRDRERPARVVPAWALCRGPGNVTHAMGITLRENRLDLRSGALYLEDRGLRVGPATWGPRIGISAGTDRHWRGYVTDSPAVSGRKVAVRG